MSTGNQNTSGVEKLLAQLLGAKDKHGFNGEQFILLLGLVNLMKIINMLEGRVKVTRQGSGGRRSSAGPDLVPLRSRLGGSRPRPSGEK